MFEETTDRGQACSYKYEGSREGLKWPVLTKKFCCPNLMLHLLKYRPATTWPPPNQPPSEMKIDFELNGKCPLVEDMFITERYSGAPRLLSWTPQMVQNMTEKFNAGRVIGNYGLDADLQVAKAMETFRTSVQGKHGLVIGSETPWVETIALIHGADKITTLEYSRIHSTHEKISSLLPTEFALQQLLADGLKYDFVFTYSSVEHSGLGRYGDALDPFGDLAIMAQAHCALKENGLLCVAVMVLDADFEKCGIAWNAHRYYGKERMQHLTANFQVVQVFPGGQPLVCMRKFEPRVQDPCT